MGTIKVREGYKDSSSNTPSRGFTTWCYCSHSVLLYVIDVSVLEYLYMSVTTWDGTGLHVILENRDRLFKSSNQYRLLGVDDLPRTVNIYSYSVDNFFIRQQNWWNNTKCISSFFERNYWKLFEHWKWCITYSKWFYFRNYLWKKVCLLIWFS